MLLVPPRPQSPWAAAEGLTQSSDPGCLSAVIYIYLGTHTAHKENIYCCGDLLPAFQAKCLTKLATSNLLTSLLIFPIVAQHSFKLYSFTLLHAQSQKDKEHVSFTTRWLMLFLFNHTQLRISSFVHVYFWPTHAAYRLWKALRWCQELW